MISKWKERVMITLPKKQLEYLRNLAKKRKINMSKLISSIILLRSNELLERLVHDTELYEEIYELAHYKWFED